MKNQILIILLLITTACSSLNKKECASRDWSELGQKDGIKGKSVAAFDDYKKDCASYSLVPDESSYRLGYAKGLKTYCTYEEGYSRGYNGKDAFKECTGVNDKFYLGFNEGHTKWMAYLATEERRRRDGGVRRGPPGAGRGGR